jgi:predicted ATPase
MDSSSTPSTISSAYSVLKKCTNTLLDNTANSGKTSEHAVSIAFEDFKKHLIEQKEYNETLIENYMKNHHLPRKEKTFAYETYMTDTLHLRNEWKRTPDAAHIIEYLRFPKPAEIMTSTDPIYTIYS